jgi:glutamate synthase domain-containing protein 2
MQFIEELRSLSQGKPIGFKLCIGKLSEWFAIIKAMLDTGTRPDFIVVDGSEGGTGAAPVEFVDHVGTPMRDGLRLVHASLVMQREALCLQWAVSSHGPAILIYAPLGWPLRMRCVSGL